MGCIVFILPVCPVQYLCSLFIISSVYYILWQQSLPKKCNMYVRKQGNNLTDPFGSLSLFLSLNCFFSLKTQRDRTSNVTFKIWCHCIETTGWKLLSPISSIWHECSVQADLLTHTIYCLTRFLQGIELRRHLFFFCLSFQQRKGGPTRLTLPSKSTVRLHWCVRRCTHTSFHLFCQRSMNYKIDN